VIATGDLEEIFSYLVPKAKEKLVVVLDEFSYLVEKDDADYLRVKHKHDGKPSGI